MAKIIRTKTAELSTIPAIAYKQKINVKRLARGKREGGGSAIKIIRTDTNSEATFYADKRTGELRARKSYNEALFPQEAIDEAQEILAGVPYGSRGLIRIVATEDVQEEEIVENDEQDFTTSDEYITIVAMYSDPTGKLNFDRLNRDFIKFASSSTTVSKMAAEGASVDEIVVFIVKSRATVLSGKKESLSDEDVESLIEALNEICVRNAFGDLRVWLQRTLLPSVKHAQFAEVAPLDLDEIVEQGL